ncbi:Uncharacterised protein [Phocoenobacter uteri]|uniref:Uncharacterized protein n=1 Tax=Phocoenobacter uteri TaxID=146806 RepID=A0A379CAU1_9PAST|nr:hypothetical protein [Phocoenobacter uteri]MDG6881255.1 hypothetical protein [Phocoenobacter uteri]SUB59279.1 Uncharacterised protein [Phocoenobacter uteri]
MKTTNSQFKLPPKKWYSLDQACEQIYKYTDENVTKDDLIHYAKIGLLKISIKTHITKYHKKIGSVRLDENLLFLSINGKKYDFDLDFGQFNKDIATYKNNVYLLINSLDEAFVISGFLHINFEYSKPIEVDGIDTFDFGLNHLLKATKKDVYLDDKFGIISFYPPNDKNIKFYLWGFEKALDPWLLDEYGNELDKEYDEDLIYFDNGSQPLRKKYIHFKYDDLYMLYDDLIAFLENNKKQKENKVGRKEREDKEQIIKMAKNIFKENPTASKNKIIDFLVDNYNIPESTLKKYFEKENIGAPSKQQNRSLVIKKKNYNY